MPRPPFPSTQPDAPRLWDIFCRVIDNYGDVGVLWRLSAELAARGERVRLWIDDHRALAWMAPGALDGSWPGVQVLPWADAESPSACVELVCAQVWIEGFACEIPDGFVAHFAARVGKADGLARPVWINLEYLSAEDYVARNHGLPSPILRGPAQGWTKYFFYPGFTHGSGGLVRNAWSNSSPQSAGLGRSGELRISLFCYEPPALEDLLRCLGQQQRSTRLLVTHGRAAQAVRQLLARADFALPAHLALEFLPALSQREYDALLAGCDLNLVRGEDSLVQALWAGKPFVWQAYPQSDAAHRHKLDAFLDWMQADDMVRALHLVWNGFGAPADRAPWKQAVAGTAAAWEQLVRQARARLLAQDDLPTRLRGLVAKNR